MSDGLPILEVIPELKQKLQEENRVVLQAAPGAGKSTVLPLELLNEPWLNGQKIIMLEPRRLAARSVALRMAELLNEEVGETVGYRVRFENKVSDRTRLEVVTEGILARMIQRDNALEGIGLIILDEFHERSIHADLALAFCKEIQQVLREDLKILVMSATLDTAILSKYLNIKSVIQSEGRQYPITYKYEPEDKSLSIPEQIVKVIKKALKEDEGDILVFLPGVGEIQRTLEKLELDSGNVLVYPLYGDLPFQKQKEAILPDPSGKRKIVLATSIAETSLTIEGIKIVIDSGYARVPKFDPRSGFTRLDTVRVTKDAADQRAGRAGRLGPGICYRLWHEAVNTHLVPSRTPEILEADLAPVLLELAQWGIKDFKSFSWLTSPGIGAINQAAELLQKLEALDGGVISDKGKAMAGLPTHPRIAHMLLYARRENLLPLAIDIAALLEEKDPLRKDSGVNIALRINALRQYRLKGNYSGERAVLERVERLAASWRRLFKVNTDNSNVDEWEAGRLIAAAYPERIAKRVDSVDNRYKLSGGRMARLNDQDALITEEWIAVAHLDAGIGEARIFLASPVNPVDLSYLYLEEDVVDWDSRSGALVARAEIKIGDLLVKSKPLEEVSEESRQKALLNAVRSEGLSLFTWTEAVEDLQARILSLKVWRPQEAWPDVTRENLLATVDTWLTPYLGTVRKRQDFAKLDIYQILLGILPWDLAQQLDTLAPSRLKVPSGSMIKLTYSNDGLPPVLAARLQEMFGLTDTPVINEGKTKVMIHLLSPGYRPVQVTQDLRSFWHTTYHEVRKELRMRYPKHFWPEDPWTAEAVRGVKRKSDS
ncbi:MAG TPA: ATP-dependent helicase HrpB [Cytophagaceae bacterium]